jgi:Fe2+ or Zn2+ uptake regulation protein
MPDKYPSKYSNGKSVSAAQYITEIICERKAQNSKQDLHYRFWIEKTWAVFYKNQIASAYKLLKQYSSKAIVKALNTETGKRIYSLRAPHLPAIIEEQEKLINQENKILNLEIVRNDDASFIIQSKKNSIISKLRNLDNDT